MTPAEVLLLKSRLPQIKGNGFVLRPYRKTVSEGESLVANINSSHIADRVTNVPHPYTLIHAGEWVWRATDTKDPTRIDFVVDVDGEVAGSIAFIELSGSKANYHEAQLSYWLGENYQGRGIMTSAVRLITKWAFDAGFLRVWGYIWSDNLASVGVLERAGFEREGTLRKKWCKNKKYHDSYLYGLTR